MHMGLDNFMPKGDGRGAPLKHCKLNVMNKPIRSCGVAYHKARVLFVPSHNAKKEIKLVTKTVQTSWPTQYVASLAYFKYCSN